MKKIKMFMVMVVCGICLLPSVLVQADDMRKNQNMEIKEMFVVDELESDCFIEIENEEISLWSLSRVIDWTIKNNVEKRSATFNLSKGDKVKFKLSFSKVSGVKVGIVNGNGHKIYRSAKGSYDKSVLADKSGTYRLFIQNKSGSKITVNGTYTR